MAQIMKETIIQTFIEMINEKPFDKITVKDIVEKCGINRNTFYYHFEDIYDLLHNVFEIRIEELKFKNITYNNWEDISKHSINFILDSKKSILHIYQSLGTKEIKHYLDLAISFGLKQYFDILFKEYQVKQEDQDFLILYNTHALTGIILEWIDGGMKEKEMDMYLTLLNKWQDGIFEQRIQDIYKNNEPD